jgi:hypothetical protein
MLAGAIALLAGRPGRAFGILALNALLHLVLDTLEIKWASGVHLLAPFSWEPLTMGVAWPESVVVSALTIAGLMYAVFAVAHARRRAPPRLPNSPRRWLAVAGASVAYATVPLAFRDAVERHDNHWVRTLRERADRPTRSLELDRTRLIRRQDGYVLRTFAGEEIKVGLASEHGSATVSVRGVFATADSVEVTALHVHAAGVRDGASYVALLLFTAVLLAGAPPLREAPGRSSRDEAGGAPTDRDGPGNGRSP